MAAAITSVGLRMANTHWVKPDAEKREQYKDALDALKQALDVQNANFRSPSAVGTARGPALIPVYDISDVVLAVASLRSHQINGQIGQKIIELAERRHALQDCFNPLLYARSANLCMVTTPDRSKPIEVLKNTIATLDNSLRSAEATLAHLGARALDIGRKVAEEALNVGKNVGRAIGALFRGKSPRTAFNELKNQENKIKLDLVDTRKLVESTKAELQRKTAQLVDILKGSDRPIGDTADVGPLTPWLDKNIPDWRSGIPDKALAGHPYYHAESLQIIESRIDEYARNIEHDIQTLLEDIRNLTSKLNQTTEQAAKKMEEANASAGQAKPG